MNTPVTYVLMVVDKSGSMSTLADDVRGGFNTYVDDLRTDTDKEYRLTVTLFDTTYSLLTKATRLADVPRLDATNYRPGGYTALLDAVGKTITEFDEKALADADRVLVVVQTDGQENSSIEYRGEQIARLIKDREDTGRWSFVFVGAGPDAWTQAKDLGFRSKSVVSNTASGQAVAGTYSGLASATRNYSRGATGDDAAAAIASASGGVIPDQDISQD